jgi:hypothetical protein
MAGVNHFAPELQDELKVLFLLRIHGRDLRFGARSQQIRPERDALSLGQRQGCGNQKPVRKTQWKSPPAIGPDNYTDYSDEK